jgi:hypothetical protein
MARVAEIIKGQIKETGYRDLFGVYMYGMPDIMFLQQVTQRIAHIQVTVRI